MAGAEGAVDLEAIGVIEEGASQREEHFLRSKVRQRFNATLLIISPLFQKTPLCCYEEV